MTSNDKVSSTNGYICTLGSGTIFWKSSKETCIASFAMELEFIAVKNNGEY